MKEKLSFLVSYINEQREILENIVEKISCNLSNFNLEDEKTTVFLSYELHNFYSGMEDLFKEVAKVFENYVEDAQKFHMELLKRMKLNIEGVRPNLISKTSYKVLNELRKFRHVFRHAYDYELNSKRVKELSELLLDSFPLIKNDLDKFKEFLKSKLSCKDSF